MVISKTSKKFPCVTIQRSLSVRLHTSITDSHPLIFPSISSLWVVFFLLLVVVPYLFNFFFLNEVHNFD